jgi:hypothetical protein
MKTVTALEAYTPTFEIDDGFRLSVEPTIEAVSNDVRRWHEFSLRGADMHLFGAFMCGVALLRARDIVGKAKRGVHGKGFDGFDTWKREQFPEISESALGNYMRFAENCFLCGNDLPKKPSVGFLGSGHKNFTCPTTKEDAGTLLSQIGTVMDGKTMTEMYRSQKRIREALPSGGDKGNHKARRTKAEIESAKIEADAEVAYQELAGSIDIALGDHRFARLSDEHLAALRERVVELKAELDVHCSRRKLNRLPANWRLTENLPHA